MRRTAFDIDCAIHSETDSPVVAPTYIAGLARAGTTILLQTLYATGQYATLTYRNMPFVMAPGLWPKLSSGARQSGQATERAHGDRLQVDYDSPEAFEEVFWITATKGLFVDAHKLHPHKVQTPGIVDYRQFVANILGGGKSSEENVGKRYLAKNNNNLLRIGSILEAFPDARIVVPFRNPYDHARSLLAQHVRFSEQHERDAFSLKYMNWLGHFEFGLNHKPFGFDFEARGDQKNPLDSLDYWLDYWTRTYAHVASKYADRVFFFNYDSFCQNPDDNLKQLAGFLDIGEDDLTAVSSKVAAANSYAADDSVLSANVRLVHKQLIALTKKQNFSGCNT